MSLRVTMYDDTFKQYITEHLSYDEITPERMHHVDRLLPLYKEEMITFFATRGIELRFVIGEGDTWDNTTQPREKHTIDRCFSLFPDFWNWSITK